MGEWACGPSAEPQVYFHKGAGIMPEEILKVKNLHVTLDGEEIIKDLTFEGKRNIDHPRSKWSRENNPIESLDRPDSPFRGNYLDYEKNQLSSPPGGISKKRTASVKHRGILWI